MIEILTFNRTNNMGLPVTYWILENFSYYNFEGNERIDLRLQGYLSKKAYLDSKTIMDSMYISVEKEAFQQYFSDEALTTAGQEGKTIYCQIYNYIQENVPELKNCEDICVKNNCTKCFQTTTEGGAQ